jgi:hypothetical protein
MIALRRRFTSKIFYFVGYGMVFFVGTLSLARPSYRPEALSEILLATKKLRAENKTPIVVFDLDDTLLNTGSRNVKIAQEFSQLPGKTFLAEKKLLAKASLLTVQYATSETLRALGITNGDFLNEFLEFWSERFFSDNYCADDFANEGAVDYVNALTDAGANVVYLTGRNELGMLKGTRESLEKQKFPTAANQTTLILSRVEDWRGD